MISRRSALTTVAVATALVLAGGASAVASNGGSFVLGKSNKATKTSTLTNSKGTPLSLSTKSKYPPLKVNSSKRVDRLNADQLDGLSSEGFALATGQTGYVAATSVLYNTSGGFGGFIAQPRCPAGTKVTGGGFSNLMTEAVFVNRPDGGNSWRSAAIGELGYDLESDLIGYAVCYNPRGVVPGASATLVGAMSKAHLQQTAKVTPDQLELAKLEKVARR